MDQDIERSLRAKVIQHVVVSIARNNRVYTPRFLASIKSLYGEAEAAHLEIKGLIPDSKMEQYRVVCREGCSHCCGLTVNVAIPELYLIFEYLRSTRSEEELKELAQDLKAYVTAMEESNSVTEKLKIKCSFLKGDKCSIYEQRPMSCRAWNSRSVSHCIEYLEDQEVDIPSSALHYTPYNVFRQGIQRALSVMGFEDIVEELNSGILRLLEGEYGT